ncbi:MAG: hypothetical protein R3B72_32910 [Polyangiaceae bacterium]
MSTSRRRPAPVRVMYCGVPTATPVAVTMLPLRTTSCLAVPKSSTFTQRIGLQDEDIVGLDRMNDAVVREGERLPDLMR